MKVLLASHNKGKIAELQALLCRFCSDVEVVSMSDIGFNEDIVEDGNTFEENALIKARVGASLGYITVADDSGLMVDALGGAPGVYSARYAGEECDNEKNNQKLLSELSGLPIAKRTAKFVSVVACVFPDGRDSIIVRGECPGVIINEYRGDGGFGYDPLFYYPEMKKTYAEMSADEKNTISHRGKAVREIAKQIGEIKE